jgi:hypothetical protein
MTTEEDDERGMGDAVERARERGGSDTFGAVAMLDSDDKPDVVEPDVAADAGPEFGPVEPPPPEPPDVAPAPPPPPEKDFAAYAPTPAPKPDTSRQDIAKALYGITSRRFTPSAAVSDEAIAKARSDRHEQVRKNDLSRAISDWLMRKPFTPTAPEDEAGQLLEQRGREQADFEKGQQRDLSAASLLARGLKGEKTPPVESQSLTDWRRAQADRLKGLETRDAAAVAETQRKGTAATAAAEAEAASVENERHALLRDPRAKAFGLTPEDIGKLDRKGLEGVRKQIETVKQPKGGGAGGAGGGGGHRLSASALSELAGYDAADEELSKLEEDGKRANIGSLKNSMVSMIPSDRLKANTDIGRYEDSARRAMQGVGIILEHGKLAAGDELKYKRLLPEAGDDAATLHRKISGLRSYLKSLKGKTEGAYSAGGYKVPGGAPDAGGGTIRVRRKSDGTTGSIPSAKFNPDKYEKLDG